VTGQACLIEAECSVAPKASWLDAQVSPAEEIPQPPTLQTVAWGPRYLRTVGWGRVAQGPRGHEFCYEPGSGRDGKPSCAGGIADG